MADNEEIDVKEYYSEAIKSLVPINELSPSLQNEIINIARITEYKKKDYIFKQGGRDEFAFYLLDGEVDLLADNHVQSTLVSSTDSARYAMARLQPRQFSARAASKKVVILQLDRGALDRLMVAEPQSQGGGGAEVEVAEIESEETGDWMSRMLQSELFCRLPTANIHQLFALLEPVEYNAGEQVIKQGDAGDYYYIIQEGRCEVSREPSSGSKPVKLAELHAGDSFGEEALLTDAKRNATITMVTDGVLMQLSKENFINLVKKPSLEAITFEEGRGRVKSGAVWLDVRFKNEHEQSHIEGSINVPLNVLRMQADKLERDKNYIIYCDTAGRSSAAAFLLTDRGYKVCYLKDGLSSVPDSELKVAKVAGEAPAGETETPQQPEAKAEEKEETVSRAESEPETEEDDDQELDPEVRSSVIDTNLARTNMDLEEANKKLREADAQKGRELKQAKKKLEAEKKKLEAEKKAIEKEARKLKQQEEEKLRKLKEEAEKRLSAEKNKLEEIYNRNTQEMEKLQRMKEEAEVQLRKEREKFEHETAEARRKLEEEAAKRKQQQEAMERAIQLKAKAKLEAEKRKMAEEFARTNEELEKARKAKAMAEAASKAARDEAKNIIDEYKKQFEAEQATEKARLEEERRKLEEESKKIQETYQEIQRAKQEAEAARAKAEKEVSELKAKQKAASAQESKAVADEIRAVEERLHEAEKNVREAETAGESIQAAREINKEELQRQKQIAEEMRAQVESDLAEFMEQQQEEDKDKDKAVAHSDHIKRIKERAAAAKREAEKATDDLFSDIASQLGKDDE